MKKSNFGSFDEAAYIFCATQSDAIIKAKNIQRKDLIDKIRNRVGSRVLQAIAEINS